MFGLVLGVVAAVACAVVALDHRNKKRRADLDRRSREDSARYQRDMNRLEAEQEQYKQEQYENQKAAREKIRRNEINRKQEFNKKMFDYINIAIKQTIDDVDKLLNDFKTHLISIKTDKSQHNTYLRKQSIDLLKSDLYKYMNKYKAYNVYLTKYCKELCKTYKDTGDLLTIYEDKLPDKWLYKDKLFYLSRYEFEATGTINISNRISCNYQITDFELLQKYDKLEKIPLLVGAFNNSCFYHEVSIKFGILQDIISNTPSASIEAEVIGYEKYGVILNYIDIELELQHNQMETPNRLPPLGSKIIVYFCDSYVKSNRQSVTEKYENSNRIVNFPNVPLLSSNENLIQFKQREDKLSDSPNWKIGPVVEVDIEINDEYFLYCDLKLQLNDDVIMICRRVNKLSSIPYLEFVEFIDDKSKLFKYDDIFWAIDLDFTLVVDNLDKEIDLVENLAMFYQMLNKEFTIQYCQSRSNGGTFFNRWEEINNRLINYKSKELVKSNSNQPMSLEISYIINTENKYVKDRYGRYYISLACNNGTVIANINKDNNSTKIVTYLTIIKNRKLTIEFNADFTQVKKLLFTDADINFIHPNIERHKEIKNVVEYFKKEFEHYLYENGNKLCIYTKQYPTPEIRQQKAYIEFREGRIGSSKLQTYVMDGSLIQYEDSGYKLTKKFNTDLNDSQQRAVEMAVNDSNLLLIQGPPGTGKTTVIQEIILQHLEINSRCNVLIASQANVAVDNVLERIVNKNTSIIRCGEDSKIADNLRCFSFEGKLDSYKEKLNLEVSNVKLRKYRAEYLRLINKETISGLVGELILKEHQIIGATCVGLSKKNIGLENIVFDLVIIDEAGKALPGELLIPINRAKKLILVGDHKQLSPVIDPILFKEDGVNIDDILEDENQDQFFDESLFRKLFKAAPATNKVTLDTQFRMPWLLGDLISNLYYSDEKLKNGNNTKDKKPFFYQKNICFFDMSNDQSYITEAEKFKDGMLINKRESQILVEIIKRNSVLEKLSMDKYKVAIITPYKKQKNYLIEELKRMKLLSQNIYINTVDAFQGEEAEVVIFCSTRARHLTKYFSAPERINVAFTRAKNELIIIGSLSYFKKYKKYGEDNHMCKIANFIENNENVEIVKMQSRKDKS